MQTDVETYENMHDVCLLELQLPPPQRTSLKSLGHMVGQVARGKSDKRDKGDKSKPGKHIRRGGSAGRHIQVFLKCSRRHCPSQNLVDIGKATALSRSMSFTAHVAEAR